VAGARLDADRIQCTLYVARRNLVQPPIAKLLREQRHLALVGLPGPWEVDFPPSIEVLRVGGKANPAPRLRALCRSLHPWAPTWLAERALPALMVPRDRVGLEWPDLLLVKMASPAGVPDRSSQMGGVTGLHRAPVRAPRGNGEAERLRGLISYSSLAR
jgi:hypothetical protein